jgi:hypothetical protein
MDEIKLIGIAGNTKEAGIGNKCKIILLRMQGA